LDSTFKLWMDSIYYCRIDETDIFYIDLHIDKLYSLNLLNAKLNPSSKSQL